KERCDAPFGLLSRGGVYYAFLFQSQAFIFAFVCLTGRLIRRCAVSVEAHYREFFPPDKRKFKKTF
ncbi:hypothetical protein, partial [Cronobacter turicensis]|uniref:hypothetical protein n=1 Tax=Cronobacter turicensis TaxID=413502 RepID=UPI001A9765D8